MLLSPRLLRLRVCLAALFAPNRVGPPMHPKEKLLAFGKDELGFAITTPKYFRRDRRGLR
jgi:hypothetical protein